MRTQVFYCLVVITVLFSVTSTTAQQDIRAEAVKTFQTGNYSKAVDLFKKTVKKDDKDAEAWYLLATSYFKLEKNKDALKACQKAVDLEPKNETYHSGLATLLMILRDNRAYKIASETLEINPNRADAHYVLGVLSYRDENYASAYDRAKRAIQIDPNFAAPYRLKSQALVASFLALGGKVLPPATRGDLMPEAVKDLEKYLELDKNVAARKRLTEELEVLRYFANYYGLPENRVVKDVTTTETPDPSKIPLKILSKPKAAYTDSARKRNVNGTVRLLVAFDASGKIGPILVAKALDEDLDGQAIRAARSMTFKPATKNGVPYSTIRTVEYSFQIYVRY